MKLLQLDVDGVRNLNGISLRDLAQVNVFYGDNGAGKTSVLEAIHILGLARSFRSTQLQPVIHYESSQCRVFGRVQSGEEPPIAIGVERPRRGKFRLRIDGSDQRVLVKLADIVPVQLINANSYSLLEGGPKRRRQFVDWGVFHVEHRFYEHWQRLQRCVRQRNSLLRSGRPLHGNSGMADELLLWNTELATVGQQVDNWRSLYVQQFLPVFQCYLDKLVDIPGVKVFYFRGWDESAELQEVLAQNQDRDLRRGMTIYGPHRADLKVMVHGIEAGQVLSRGQQKLVVCAMRLAQCELLHGQGQKKCLLLVDDLPAEIDEDHQQRLCQMLASLDMQLFLTCVSPDSLIAMPWNVPDKFRLFHVKQGQIEQSESA